MLVYINDIGHGCVIRQNRVGTGIKNSLGFFCWTTGLVWIYDETWFNPFSHLPFKVHFLCPFYTGWR